ncbi:hypothetical protein [Candidatus Nitrosacidococcus tergens]|uniref:Transmembrane protein n=1 Tax=Candidatus Nitrosacidococcus tergens TaxID=553981 RepID=A0A7G1Q7I0_9GAMM|nr:hypothetical protein [Candidatus Nitrosacidococcus tergens]CAB1274379.1 conserved membrane protein of unknown function, cytochrome oxidase associated [Candidatus Nitrosacidococcus tergens]
MRTKIIKYTPYILWLSLALPPLRYLLESSMTMHMLVQLPILAVIGWKITPTLSNRIKETINLWNRWGISGTVSVIFTMLYWMLPRSLDTAISDPYFELIKFITVPLFIGAALGLSWYQLHPVARGVLMLEFWATFMRLGWLYVVLPNRLCANYLLGDQQVLGRSLLMLGTIWAVSWSFQILFGVRWNKLISSIIK